MRRTSSTGRGEMGLLNARTTVVTGGSGLLGQGYARSLDPSKRIEPLSLKDVTFVAPVDTSLDTSRFRALTETPD